MSQEAVDLVWDVDTGAFVPSDYVEGVETPPEVVQADLFEEPEAGSNLLVYKRNELIHARFALSAFSQKTMAALIARINPSADEIPSFEFSVSEFAAMMGVSRQMVYKVIEDVTDELQRQVARLPPRDRDHDRQVAEEREKAKEEGRAARRIPRPEVDPRSFEKVNWFHKSTYLHQSGRIIFTFHEDMRGYLIDFSNNFTQFHLRHVLEMRSGYSIRLYEILRSYLSLKYVARGQTEAFRIIQYQALRDMLGIDEGQYKRFYDFERFVLKQAQTELADTDLKFEYSIPERKTSNSRAKVKSIRFHVRASKAPSLIGEGHQGWLESLKAWLPPAQVERLLEDLPHDQVQRNVEMVVQQLADGKEIKSLKGYLISAIKRDMEGTQGALNPYAYKDEAQQSFVRERLLVMWESLPNSTRQEFIDHRFRKGMIAQIFKAFKAETGQQSVSESLMNIGDMDY